MGSVINDRCTVVSRIQQMYASANAPRPAAPLETRHDDPDGEIRRRRHTLVDHRRGRPGCGTTAEALEAEGGQSSHTSPPRCVEHSPARVRAIVVRVEPRSAVMSEHPARNRGRGSPTDTWPPCRGAGQSRHSRAGVPASPVSSAPLGALYVHGAQGGTRGGQPPDAPGLVESTTHAGSDLIAQLRTSPAARDLEPV